MKLQLTILIMVLSALLVAVLLPAAIRYWKGVWRNFKLQTSNSKRISRRRLAMQRRLVLATLFAPFVWAQMRLALWHQRVFGGEPTALANELGIMNEHGIESLIIDPNGTFPFTSRYLLVKRGATGKQYGDLAGAGDYPLGPSSDAPFQAGDVLNVRRLGARPGLEIGIAVAAQAITVDHLLVGVAGGKVQDITTVTANATFWVVGRACNTIAATNSTMEIGYVPCVPYELTVSNNGGTYAAAGAGV